MLSDFYIFAPYDVQNQTKPQAAFEKEILK